MSFQTDLNFGEQGELFVLEKLHYKYPKAYKVQGYYKEWDLFIPEKELMEWKALKGLVITPPDTNLVGAIVGMYFGGSLVKK